jgi:hypothetical protein
VIDQSHAINYDAGPGVASDALAAILAKVAAQQWRDEYLRESAQKPAEPAR